MQVLIDKTGKQATIKVKKLTGSDLKKMVIHLKGLTGKDETIEFDGRKDIIRIVSLIKHSNQ
jgi:hypothetical protein